MAYVRKVRTASGAVAVQVARRDSGRVVILEHVGSAHTDAELGILLNVAAGSLMGSKRSWTRRSHGESPRWRTYRIGDQPRNSRHRCWRRRGARRRRVRGFSTTSSVRSMTGWASMLLMMRCSGIWWSPGSWN